jgi:hypothetical protein
MKKTAQSLRRSATAKFVMGTPEVKNKHSESIKKLQNDPSYHEKRNSALQEKYKDPIWQENINKANKAKPLDPKYKAAHLASYTPESNKRRSESCKKTLGTLENKKRASIHTIELWENDEHRIKIQQCIKTPLGVFESMSQASKAHNITQFSTKFKKENAKNPEQWSKITREEYENLVKFNIPFIVPPAPPGAPKFVFTEFGVFRGLAEAGRYAADLGIPNARKWVSKQINDNPDKFYFISKEEYDLLKGT